MTLSIGVTAVVVAIALVLARVLGDLVTGARALGETTTDIAVVAGLFLLRALLQMALGRVGHIGAREVIAEVGYGGLTFTEVAARAGTSVPAIRRRWPSKSHLAHRVVFSPSRLTYRIGELKRRGLVQRIADDKDGRGASAQLTEAGRAAFTRAARAHSVDVEHMMLADLTPEEAHTLVRVFGRVRDSLSEPRGGS